MIDVGNRFPGDGGRAASISLIEEGTQCKVRMANLAIVGSHSTNGVAAIHSALLRKITVKDLAEMYPDRFNNKTMAQQFVEYLLSHTAHEALRMGGLQSGRFWLFRLGRGQQARQPAASS